MNKNTKPRLHMWPIIILATIVISMLSMSSLAQPVAINQSLDAPWPMWRQNPAHTGVVDGSGPKKLAVKWKFGTGAPVDSSPSVVGGRVYIGSRDRNLYCLDAQTGSFIWKYTTGWKIRSTPAIINDKVYTGADDGNVYCLDANNGQLLWKTATEGGLIMSVIQPIAQIRSSPTVLDDKVYVGHLDGYVYCLDANTGNIIWKYRTFDRVVSSPAVVDGMAYIGSCDGYVRKLDAKNGKVLWMYDNRIDNPHPSQSRTEVDVSPCVVNGTVYIYGNAGFWYALDAETGTVKWRYLINSYRNVTGASSSMPYGSMAYAKGRIYFVDLSYAACANANTGEILWENSLGSISYSSSAYADGKVYIGGDSTIVHVFDSGTGEKLSAYEIGSNMRSSCSIAYDNLYVGSGDWNLYCLTEAPPKPPKTKTSISGALSATEVMVNTPMTVKGTIAPAPQTAQVIVTFKLPDGSTKDVSATTNADGTYEVSYSPDVVGTWAARSWWAGNDLSQGASALEATFTVTSAPQPPAANIPVEFFYAIIAALLIAATIAILVHIQEKIAKWLKSQKRTFNVKG